jgi:hypothetical protein
MYVKLKRRKIVAVNNIVRTSTLEPAYVGLLNESTLNILKFRFIPITINLSPNNVRENATHSTNLHTIFNCVTLHLTFIYMQTPRPFRMLVLFRLWLNA